MNIVTYNLRFGGAGAIHWSQVIAAFDPDLFLVQESYSPRDHLPGTPDSELKARSAWRPTEGRLWGSGVYVKRGTLRPLDFPTFPGWLVGAEVDGFSAPASPRRRLRVHSLHAPRWEITKMNYPATVNAMLDLIGKHQGDADLVIGGDFNVTVSQRHPSERRATDAADLAIQARLRDEFGLVNCWQAANPDAPLAQTLRWSCGETFPYHCDGLFVPASWLSALRSCTVAGGHAWSSISDHNPVVASFSDDLPS